MVVIPFSFFFCYFKVLLLINSFNLKLLDSEPLNRAYG